MSPPKRISTVIEFLGQFGFQCPIDSLEENRKDLTLPTFLARTKFQANRLEPRIDMISFASHQS